jgi:thiol-disulfide isomerase/thioredoxin
MLKTTLINRRQLLATGLAALAEAAAGGSVARAAPLARLSDEELLGALQNVFWTSAQAPNSKTFYVIATPWCGYCKKLYGELRNKTGFQARFMLTAPHSDEDRKLIAYAILSQSAQGLDAIYARRKAPEALGTEAAREFATDVNTAAETALMGALKARLPGGHYGYPILIFNAAGRVNVVAGAPQNPDELLAMVEAPGGVLPEVSGLAPFLSNPPVVSKTSREVGARRQGVGIHVAPAAASPKLHVLNRAETLPVVGETTVSGRKWLAFQVFRQGRPLGYGLAEEFAG